MNAICAWCGKSLGVRRGPEGRITHGICAECKLKFEAKEDGLDCNLEVTRCDGFTGLCS